MRVLVIEDEERLAENIVGALRETGLAVDRAADGEAEVGQREHVRQRDQHGDPQRA